MRVALLAAVVACATGCNQILGIGDFHIADGGTPDAPASCFGSTTLYKFCPPIAPSATVLINQDVNTDTDDRCVKDVQPNGPDLCVIGGDTVTVQQMAHITGMRPLVLVAVQTIVVDGILDASSQHPGPGPGRIGAGANVPGICASPAGTLGTGGAGGGAGGSFGAKGGDGSTNGGGSGDNGIASAPITLAGIQAGCAGGAGGLDTSGAGGAGAGGGAVYLIAGRSIDVTTQGRVYASGAGGTPAMASHSGGGGAGAGGLIGLDAAMITVEGVVTANGGGGGGGTNGSPAMPGEDGSTMDFTHQAAGGNSAGGGGDGGDGGAQANAAEDGKAATSTDGGGGGGGSVGIVWTKGTVTGNISPDVTAH